MAEKDIKKTEGEQDKTAAEKTEEKTVGAIIEESTGEGENGGDKTPKGDPETVPLAVFLEVKKDNKELTKALKDLEKKSNEGSSKEEISDEIDALADEFDMDKKFVAKLTKILESRAEKKVGETMKPLLERDATLTKKERDDLIDKAFKTHYAIALEKMPEYSDIANADAIKALSLLPENAKKTFPQLLEETYGKAITGKRTIEETKPGGGKEPEPLDYDKAKRDPEYFKEIMSNPELKAQYNKRMLEPKNRRS